MTLEEKWVPVEGFGGVYEVSSLGRVRGEKGTLKPEVNKDGHLRVTLYLKGRGKKFFIHRLMALGFLSNPEKLPLVRHLNDIPYDNRLENLSWGTVSDNVRDAVRNKVHRNSKKTHCAQGHEYTTENTELFRGYERRCKECTREWARESRKRRTERGLPEGDKRHGTLTGYTSYGCKCEACKEASREYEKNRGSRVRSNTED